MMYFFEETDFAVSTELAAEELARLDQTALGGAVLLLAHDGHRAARREQPHERRDGRGRQDHPGAQRWQRLSQAGTPRPAGCE